MAIGIPVIPMVGASLARKTSFKENDLGTPQLDTDNQTYVYVQFTNAAANGADLQVSGAFAATAWAAGTHFTNTGDAAAAGDYGWVMRATSPLN